MTLHINPPITDLLTGAALLLLVTGLVSVVLFQTHSMPDMDYYWLHWLEELGRAQQSVAAYAATQSDYPPL